MSNATYHHTQQLRLRHLKVGQVFQFVEDIKTSPWFRMDGTPGEQNVVYSAGQDYVLKSPRRIQPVTRRWDSNGKQRIVLTGKVSTLGKGASTYAVTCSAF